MKERAQQSTSWATFFGGTYATHRPGADVLAVEQVTVRYGNRVALEAVSFTVRRGEQIAIVGPNGAGKSTLLKVVAGILTPDEGAVRVYGAEPDRHVCIAYVPQRSAVDWHFPITVAEVVMMGRLRKRGLFHRARREDREKVQEALVMVGMEALAHRQIGQLSGGQQQRMFIARALAQEAALMLMDEPLTGLDLPAQERILGILAALRERNVTVLLSTHDLEQAADRFDRILLLRRRLLAFGHAEEVLRPDLLLEAYGGHLRVVPMEDKLLAVADSCCGGGEEGVR